MSNPGYITPPPWNNYSLSELWRIKTELEHRLTESDQRVSELSVKLANKKIDTVPASYELHQLRKIASIVYRQNKDAEDGKSVKITLPEELENILNAMFDSPPPSKNVDIKPSKQFTIEVDGISLNVNPVPIPPGSGSLFHTDFVPPDDALTFEEAQTRLKDKTFNPLGKSRVVEKPKEQESPKSGKNAYEIRLDILMKATELADGDPDKALEIAEKLYKFVDGKRR